MALVYGVSLLIGALSGAKNPISPLTGFHASATQTEVAKLPFQPVKSSTELTSMLNNAKGKIVMLDFYADWCVACKELEQNTFSDPTLRSALKNAVLLQADVTQNTADDIALLQRFGLYGPPGVIFFDQSGHEIAPSKIVGFKESATFLTAINQANLSQEKTCNASVAC
jgi:thiol:disulfide interchange protein DsbD